jgi:hypothetical protein
VRFGDGTFASPNTLVFTAGIGDGLLGEIDPAAASTGSARWFHAPVDPSPLATRPGIEPGSGGPTDHFVRSHLANGQLEALVRYGVDLAPVPR